MRLADVDGAPRSSLIQQYFGEDSQMLKELSDRFILRFFQFSSEAERIDDVSRWAEGAELDDGTRDALDLARRYSAGWRPEREDL